MPWAKLKKLLLLGLISTVPGCAGSSALPPEIVRYIPCATLEPFLYRDGDASDTLAWGDRYNSIWEVLCESEAIRQ
jgi:hypothetical protein